MYEFHNEGFFGYGEEGDFTPYGLAYFIPLILFAAAIVLTVLKRDKLRAWKGEKTFRLVFAFVLMMFEMSYYWRVLYVGTEGKGDIFMTLLPLQICEWGSYCAIFMMVSLSDTLFGINYFVTLTGAGIALLVPQMVISNSGPGYYHYYSFWGEHLLPIFAVFYVMIVHGKRPRYRHIWISYGCMFLLGIPATLLNLKYEKANYMYLKTEVSFIPDSYVLRVVIFTVGMLLLFHMLWGIWVLVEKKRKKKLAGSAAG